MGEVQVFVSGEPGEDDRIEISTSHSLDTQKCALVHEILHGIDEMYKLGLKKAK